MTSAPIEAEIIEQAWGLLANVSEGDWTRQTAEWQEAVVRWRDEMFHPWLDRTSTQDWPIEDEAPMVPAEPWTPQVGDRVLCAGRVLPKRIVAVYGTRAWIIEEGAEWHTIVPFDSLRPFPEDGEA